MSPVYCQIRFHRCTCANDVGINSWDGETEGTAFPFFTLRPDLAPLGPYEIFGNEKAKARAIHSASHGAICTEELGEKPGLVSLRDADARIEDINLYKPCLLLSCDSEIRATRGIFQGVTEQIADDLGESKPVGPHLQIRWDVQHHLYLPLVYLVSHGMDNVLDLLLYAVLCKGKLQASGLYPGGVEKIIDHDLQPATVFPDGLQIPLLSII